MISTRRSPSLYMACLVYSGIPATRSKSLLSLLHYCCCSAPTVTPCLAGDGGPPICHCWSNFHKLACKHGKEASWGVPVLPCMLHLGQTLSFLSTLSFQSLLQDNPEAESVFTGFSIAPAIAAALPGKSQLPPSSVMVPGTSLPLLSAAYIPSFSDRSYKASDVVHHSSTPPSHQAASATTAGPGDSPLLTLS